MLEHSKHIQRKNQKVFKASLFYLKRWMFGWIVTMGDHRPPRLFNKIAIIIESLFELWNDINTFVFS